MTPKYQLQSREGGLSQVLVPVDKATHFTTMSELGVGEFFMCKNRELHIVIPGGSISIPNGCYWPTDYWDIVFRLPRGTIFSAVVLLRRDGSDIENSVYDIAKLQTVVNGDKI